MNKRGRRKEKIKDRGGKTGLHQEKSRYKREDMADVEVLGEVECSWRVECEVGRGRERQRPE